MKRDKTAKTKYILPALLAVLILLELGYFVFTKLGGKSGKVDAMTLDKPGFYPADSAIPFYTQKWLENVRFGKKGILTGADIRISSEGEVSRISFDKDSINIDKVNKVNYPYVVRIELTDPQDGMSETLYFSKARYDAARIYRFEGSRGKTEVKWQDIKVGDYATVTEEINLLVPNTDSKNNFIDRNVKTLTITLGKK